MTEQETKFEKKDPNQRTPQNFRLQQWMIDYLEDYAKQHKTDKTDALHRIAKELSQAQKDAISYRTYARELEAKLNSISAARVTPNTPVGVTPAKSTLDQHSTFIDKTKEETVECPFRSDGDKTILKRYCVACQAFYRTPEVPCEKRRVPFTGHEPTPPEEEMTKVLP